MRRAPTATPAGLVYPSGTPQTPEPIDLQEHHAPELERQLLRRWVRRTTVNRWACSTCGRSPLVGERLHVYAPEGIEKAVCDLCLKSAPDRAFGELIRTERVRAGERPLSVAGLP
jgi:hypothetical protein